MGVNLIQPGCKCRTTNSDLETGIHNSYSFTLFIVSTFKLPQCIPKAISMNTKKWPKRQAPGKMNYLTRNWKGKCITPIGIRKCTAVS